jgi:hypothetical protein
MSDVVTFCCVDIFGAMSPTDSSLLGMVGASLVTATFHRCAVYYANSSLNDTIGTPVKAAALLLGSMSDAYSTLLGIFGTSLEAAALNLRTMRDTHSSVHNFVGTPLKAASFCLSAVRDTKSSLYDIVVTSHEAAALLLHLCSMGDTHSCLHGSIGTTLKAAPFVFCAVRDAHSTRNGSIGTPLRPAFCFYSFIRCNRSPTVAFHLRRLQLHLRLRLLLDDDAFVDNSSTSTGRHGRSRNDPPSNIGVYL